MGKDMDLVSQMSLKGLFGGCKALSLGSPQAPV